MNTPESRPFDHVTLRDQLFEQLADWHVTDDVPSGYFTRWTDESREVTVSIDDGTVRVIEYTPAPAHLEKARTTFVGITPNTIERLYAWIAAINTNA